MLNPVCTITINNLVFKACMGFKVESHLDNLSTTGQVTLPLHAVYRTDEEFSMLRLDEEIKEGDAVTIDAGYLQAEINRIFTGFVSVVQKGQTLTIQLEDAMFLLRKKPVVLNLKNVDLKDVLTELTSGTEVEISDETNSIKIDRLNYKGNAAGALAKIKESLKLVVYIDSDNKLYAGGMQLNKKDKIRAIYGRNIYKNRLKYQTKESNPVQVEVIGKKPDNTEVKKVVGMEGGSKYTLYRYNVTDEKTLESIGREYLERYSFDGFKGKLEMWFIPFAKPGGSFEYENKNYEQEKGTYHIKGVTYEFSSQKGLMQTIDAGAKL